MLDLSLAEKLSPRAAKWFAYAIAGMVCADGVVDDEELLFLKKTVQFLDNVDEINELVTMVKKRDLPELPILQEVGRANAFNMLKGVARIAITDSKVAKSEAAFLKYAGKQLGFDAKFVEKLIKWADAYYMLRKEEENLQRLALTTESAHF